jgi:hypothetical protein
MSNFQLTPIEVLDSGPMGGFRGGMADSRALAHSDSNLATEDLTRQKLQDELETSKLNRPMDAIKRAAEMAKLEEEMALRKEGVFAQKQRTELDTMQQDLLKKKTDAELTQRSREGESMVEAAQRLQQISAEMQQNPTFMSANWDNMTEPMKRAGVKNIPSTYSPEAVQRIQANAQAWTRSAEYIRKEMLEREKSTLDTDRDLTKIETEAFARSAENRQHEAFLGQMGDKNRATQIQVAQIHAADRGGGSGAMTNTKLTAAAIQKVSEYVDNPEGIPADKKPTSVEFNIAREALFGKELRSISNDKNNMRLMTLEAEAMSTTATPEQRKAAIVAAEEERDRMAMTRIPGYRKFVAAQAAATGGKAPEPTPAATSGSGGWGPARVKGQ